MNPFVSVVIPVYNDSDRLLQCLDALEQQTYVNYEIIVVDNNSDYSLYGISQISNRVRCLQESRQGSYAARNRGVRAAKGEIIAFTDSDCIPDPNWIASGVAGLMCAPNVGLVAGHIELTYQRNIPSPIEYLDRVLHLNQSRYALRGYAATGNAFTWAWMFSEVGMFSDSMLYLGDREWGERVSRQGYAVLYLASALVRHPARARLTNLLRKVRLQASYLPLFDTFKRIHIWELLQPLQQDVYISLQTDPNLPTLRSRLLFILLLYLVRYVKAWVMWRHC